MKTAKLCMILLALVACSKPPTYNPQKSGDVKGGKPDPWTPQGPNVGPKPDPQNPVIGTVPSDKYLGLTCSNTDPKGFRAWRRLSNKELKNTIVEVFGANVEGEVKELPDDINKHDVYDTAMVPVNFVDIQRFRGIRAIAKNVANKADLPKLFPCLKEGESCMTKTLPDFGQKAWRRPLTPDEVTKLVAIFKGTTADGLSVEEAAKYVIQAIIGSHNFIYRSEMGDKPANGVYTLTPWEVASAISYTVLRIPPDEKLRAAAAANKLNTSEAIKAEVARLFADPRAKGAWRDFANMWLDSRAILEGDKKVKEFDKGVREKARDEVGELFSEVINKTSGSTLEALLTADSVPSAAGNNIVYDAMSSNGRITFKEPERRGVLGQTSYLASHANVEDTSPVKRGAFIVERLLCTGFAPAPIIELPERVPGESNKKRYAKIAAIEACGKCHNTIHSFGFPFENYDAIGRWRAEADGEKVDASSKVNIDGEEQTISGPAELSSVIAKSKQGKECFSRHVFRYGMGRLEYAPLLIVGGDGKPKAVSAQADADSCQIKAMTDKMEEANGDMKTPIINLLTSPAFLKRIDRRSELKE